MTLFNRLKKLFTSCLFNKHWYRPIHFVSGTKKSSFVTYKCEVCEQEVTIPSKKQQSWIKAQGKRIGWRWK